MKKIALFLFFILLFIGSSSNAQSTYFNDLISNLGPLRSLTYNIHSTAGPGNSYRFISHDMLQPQAPPHRGFISLEYRDYNSSTWFTTMIFSQNQVGIGVDLNSMPTGYRLYVKDGILTEKVKVALKSTSDWADYVFEDDYELMPLNEVETFINENKHLPGISSAETLVEEGIDLGAMQAKLLEKIEELTLYLIQKDKEIAELRQQVKLLSDE